MHRDLSNRAVIEILYRDIAARSVAEILPKEVSFRDLANRAAIEILYRDLARRPLIEILYGDGDLVKRTEILLRDLLYIDYIYGELEQWDLLQRSSVEISYRHLIQVTLQRDFAQQLLQRTCQGDLAHDLLQIQSGISSSRDHLEWTPCFIILSAFPFKILTATHSLGSLAG